MELYSVDFFISDTFKLDEDRLILECRVRAQPSPTVTWLKDGKIIEMNHRYRQSDLAEGICHLQIFNPSDYDNGMYTCRAENKSGFSECTSRAIHYENAGKKFAFLVKYMDHYNLVTSAVVPSSDVSMGYHRKRHILASDMHSTVDHDIHSYNLPNSWDSERSIHTYRPDNISGHSDYNTRFDGGCGYMRENGKPAIFISRPVDKLINACGGEDVSLSFRVGGVPKPKGIVDINDTNGIPSKYYGTKYFTRILEYI